MLSILKKSFSKKQYKLISVLTIAIIIILTTSLLLVFFEKQLIEQEYFAYQETTGQKIFSLEEELQEKESKIIFLKEQKSLLENKVSVLEKELGVVSEAKEELLEEAEQTIEKILFYEKEIQASMEWFRTNSFLDEKHSRLIQQLRNNCLREYSNSCEINLACFYLINSEFQNFSYIPDTTTSGELDRMQSVNQFIENKGGDCEDFSLLFKAEYNTITKNCFEQEKEIGLFAWREGREKFWLNYSRTWFFENAQKVFLEKDFVYPSMICGMLYDFRAEKIGGHCIIAFTKKTIKTVEDILLLDNAPMIEPQNGLYLGRINSDSGVNIIGTDSFVSNQPHIFRIITSEDLFLYSNEEWLNYASFEKQLAEQRQKLGLLIE